MDIKKHLDQSRILSYASTFVTYLIRTLQENIRDVDAIILYGSVAKGEASGESDVDIFVDTKDGEVIKIIERISKEFLDSREAALYKMEGMGNEINIKVGELQQWKDLHHSIMNSGIVLWQKYKMEKAPEDAKHNYLFFWDKIGKNRGAFLNIVYGYTIGKKKYKGLVQKKGGMRTGKSSILVPAEYQEEFIVLFKKYKVQVRQKEVWVYE